MIIEIGFLPFRDHNSIMQERNMHEMIYLFFLNVKAIKVEKVVGFRPGGVL